MAEVLQAQIPDLEGVAPQQNFLSDPPSTAWTVYRKRLNGYTSKNHATFDFVRNGSATNPKQWNFSIPAKVVRQFDPKFQVVFMTVLYKDANHSPTEYRAVVEMITPDGKKQELWPADKPIPVGNQWGEWKMDAVLPKVDPVDDYVISLGLDNRSEFSVGSSYIAILSIELRFTHKSTQD